MPTNLKTIAKSLRTARENKGMSQRALGQRVGLPQSHISKIESGTVDLQTASLIELARVLDLEVALLPREVLTTLRAIANSNPRPAERTLAPVLQSDVDHLLRRIRDTEHAVPNFSELRDLAETLTTLRSQPRGPLGAAPLHSLNHELRKLLSTLQRRRNAIGDDTNSFRILRAKAKTLNDSYRSLMRTGAHEALKEQGSQEPAYRLRNESDER